MRLTTETFCKTKHCPSTDVLLLYAGKQLGEIERGIVSNHLFECEFCAAELQLISKHPPCEPQFVALETPFQIKRIAEMVFGSQPAELQFLRIFFSNERFWTQTELPLSV